MRRQSSLQNKLLILTFNSFHSYIEEAQNKRNVIQFGVMIICATGRNPLDYNLYGCWCGIGGGGNPVDDVDR